MHSYRARLVPVLAIFVWLTSCANTGNLREGGSERDWNTRLDSTVSPDLSSVASDYYLLLHDTAKGNRGAIRLSIRILSSGNASLSALGDDYAYLAEIVYRSAIERGVFWDEVRLLDPEQQQRLIRFLDSANQSQCYRFVDWPEERQGFLSNRRP